MVRPFVFLSFLLVACAPDADVPGDVLADFADGFAPPPPAGTPTLSVPTVVHGDRLTLTVTSPRVGAAVLVFQAGRTGSGPCYGICLDIVRPALIGRATVGADGRAVVSFDVPERSAGASPVFQAIVRDQGVYTKTRVVSRAVSDPIAVLGSWVDDYGYGHDIDNHVWFDFGTYEVQRFSNAERWVVAQNGPDAFGAGLWSRFDWTTDLTGANWYCQTVYDAPTLAAALVPARADDTDPTSAGCGGVYPGGFAWTRLSTADLPVTGQWTDSWGDAYTIDEHTWVTAYGTWNLTQWYAARGFLVARNDLSNSFAPGLWSRFDWTTDANGDLWYCQSAYDAKREADAVETPAADATDPATAGCGGVYPAGFSWTRLLP